jgi:hypothetical protein
MIERFQIVELAESIIASGLHTFDPIIAYRGATKVIVLEGNRRVATLKLLLQPELAPARHRSTWAELSRKAEPIRSSLTTTNVRIYPDRNAADVTAYIGFRHVTGVLTWPAFEKAKFIARLVDRHHWDYREIARRLGSYPKHVERHYVAHQLVRQALDDGLPGARQMEDAFGVLLRALQASGVSEFLGVTYPGDPTVSAKPVPQEKTENLKSFIEWTFGTEEKARILPDSRDLTRWGLVLKSDVAVSYLRRAPKPDFERAWFRSGGQVSTLTESLLFAADRLQECVPLVPQYKTDTEVMAGVTECTKFFVQILANFPSIQTEFGVRLATA